MEFIADLHLHSHFSRATAKNLDLENTCKAARIKGITLVGTGDFTHPGWFKELQEKLEPAEDGLFKLKKQINDNLYHYNNSLYNNNLPDNIGMHDLCRNSVRFILQCEISSIYKKDGIVRKNHNLIFFPDMASVKAFNEKLGKIGNITSDGRPILGLDCEKLLEIMLETSEDGFMIPAHIWTPWFSMFGSKSGFDSVEECFGSLAHHIFAVETGLSSDLPMNWRIENLDRMSFISSSDAHSPMFMGRNASCFNTSLSYTYIKNALKKPYFGNPHTQNNYTQNNYTQNNYTQNNYTQNNYTQNNCTQNNYTQNICTTNPYLGTIDMYPQEGKYHYDGHRKCNISFNPSETARHGGICPKCRKPLTLGVLYRVQQLASRPEGYIPENRHGYLSIIPLAEILSEIFGISTKSKKIDVYYTKAIATLGSELDILLKREIDEIDRAGIPLLSEAIRRMRNKEIYLTPGFDGEFGCVTVFNPEEKERLKGEISMFQVHSIPKKAQAVFKEEQPVFKKSQSIFKEERTNFKEEQVSAIQNYKLVSSLNPEQQKAILSKNRPLLMEAGPGTGKTHTLTEKILSLITNDRVNPESILALTFTNKAAKEMSQRIEKISNTHKEVFQQGVSQQEVSQQGVFVSTFHGFCLMVLKEYTNFQFTIADETLRKALIEHAIKIVFPDNFKKISSAKIELEIALIKQENILKKDEGTIQILAKYQELLSYYQLVDFEDLMVMVLDELQDKNSVLARLKNRFAYIFVDEYQDINKSQYQLIKLMAGNGKTLCVIGDPDQSIYQFRGADNRYFSQFEQDYPNTERIVFKRNYRSTETILQASFQLITSQKNEPQKEKLFSGIKGDEQQINIIEAASEVAEAVMIGKTIEHLLGGISMFSMDSGKADGALKDQYSFSDIAVLYRTKKQSEILSQIFEKAGIPFQTADRDNIFLQKGIKEMISFLRIFLQIGTFYDFEVLSGYQKKLTECCSYVKGKPSAEILRDSIICFELEKIINKSKKSIETATLLIKEAEHYPDPILFYEHISMKKDIDTVEYQAEKVSLMTMHSSKGLEFKIIFIAGCANGLIPFFHYKTDDYTEKCDQLKYQNLQSENIDEERRLFYVAMTRAEERLYLCYPKTRQIYGKTVKMEKSPFLNDIKETLKHYSKNKSKKAKKSNSAEQLELFNKE